MNSLDELKDEILEYVSLRMGEGIIDIEIDRAHFDVAYNRAIGVYRQKAQNSTEESYIWLDLQKDKSVYTLPKEVTHVRQVFRRTMGATSGTGASFDPFSSATLNVYMLNFSHSGGLATYELYAQYQEMAARMFGGYINFTFNASSKKLQLIRNIRGDGETVLLWTYNLRPEVQLLTDLQTSQWIKDFTYSTVKQIIGEARSKFAQISGPNGGTSLNGSDLKSEAKEEIELLLEDLKNYVDNSDPLSFIIG